MTVFVLASVMLAVVLCVVGIASGLHASAIETVVKEYKHIENYKYGLDIHTHGRGWDQ